MIFSEDFERIEAGIGVKRNANGDIVKNFCFSWKENANYN